MKNYLLMAGLILIGCSNAAPVTLQQAPAAGEASGACTHIVANGTYSGSIDARSYPAGSTVCAETDGKVIFTGDFEPRGYNMRGFVVAGNREKSVADGVFERMSFIGGPPCGNVVNTYAGDNAVIRNSVFFGEGGRYLLLAYQVGNVQLSDVLFRVDGGWGESQACNEYEPNAALAFYDSNSSTCEGCILIDSRVTAEESSERLGGLGVNAHTEDECFDIEFRDSASFDDGYFWVEGNGRCEPVFENVRGSFNFNIRGEVTVSNSKGKSCNSWNGPVRKFNSMLETGNCASQGSVGTLELNSSFLDDPRWRSEMCERYSDRRDGWCARDLKLSDYLSR
ncbi:MAG: hypothetical protein PVI79_18750 [Gammaproteobacteria bacterium]|jgi:hypothetical protein